MASNDVYATPQLNTGISDNEAPLNDTSPARHETSLPDDISSANSNATSQPLIVVSSPDITINACSSKPDTSSQTTSTDTDTNLNVLDNNSCSIDPLSDEEKAEISNDTDTASETESFVDALDDLQIGSTNATFNSDDQRDASIFSSDTSQPGEYDYDRFSGENPSERPYDTDPTEFDLCDDEKLSMGREESENVAVIDEECIKAKEALLSDDEKQERRLECRRLKDLGNERYKDGEYNAAVDLYTDALVACLLGQVEDRAIIYSNRAAAKMKQDKNDAAIEDCSKAVELNPDYLKALLRRAELYEKTDKLDEAFADYQKALERDPSLHQARAACMRLPDQIKERNEKMKDEMISKLKDLGNLVLRPFGLSTNNFQLQQDPATGGYSVKFQQNAS